MKKILVLVLMVIASSQSLLNAINQNYLRALGRAIQLLSGGVYVATPLIESSKPIAIKEQNDQEARDFLDQQKSFVGSAAFKLQWYLRGQDAALNFIRNEIIKHSPDIKPENIAFHIISDENIGVCTFLNKDNQPSAIFAVNNAVLSDIKKYLETGKSNAALVTMMHEIGHIKEKHDEIRGQANTLFPFAVYGSLLTSPYVRDLFKKQATNTVSALVKKSLLLQILNLIGLSGNYLLQQSFNRYLEERADTYAAKNIHSPEAFKLWGPHIKEIAVKQLMTNDSKSLTPQEAEENLEYHMAVEPFLKPLLTHPPLSERIARFNEVAEQKEYLQQKKK